MDYSRIWTEFELVKCVGGLREVLQKDAGLLDLI